jgi:hypothetical protein
MLKLDIESIRVPHERTYAARVEQHPLCGALASQLVPADAKEVRRRLMASSLRLTESMAPAVGSIRWQPSLPFRVEISEISGAKVYRVTGLQ